MTKKIASLALAFSLMTGIASAYVNPTGQANQGWMPLPIYKAGQEYIISPVSFETTTLWQGTVNLFQNFPRTIKMRVNGGTTSGSSTNYGISVQLINKANGRCVLSVTITGSATVWKDSPAITVNKGITPAVVSTSTFAVPNKDTWYLLQASTVTTGTTALIQSVMLMVP